MNIPLIITTRKIENNDDFKASRKAIDDNFIKCHRLTSHYIYVVANIYIYILKHVVANIKHFYEVSFLQASSLNNIINKKSHF